MSKKTFSYFTWLVVVIAVAVFLFWLFGLRAAAPQVPQSVSDAQPPTPNVPHEESLSERVVENAAGHYRLTVPMNWYVEKSGTTGIALYPDYDPTAAGRAECKIEISVLPNTGNLSLAEWLPGYLRQDPTGEISVISQTGLQVARRNAIKWIGTLNSIPATLVYVQGNKVVYEVAPSPIETSVGKTNDCVDLLSIIFKTFTITSP